MIRLNDSTTGEEIPAEQGRSEVGYCKPPQEHRFKKGVSGNPSGPRKGKTNLWPTFCRFMDMTDAEIDKLDTEKLTQAQHAALKLRDVARNGKSGFVRLALAVVDREEGKALQTQVVEDKRANVPMTREELQEALRELDEVQAEATRIQIEVNKRVG